MAKMTFDASAYTKQLDQLGADFDAIAKSAVYDAAAIVAKSIEAEIANLPRADEYERGSAQNPIDGITDSQRAGLIDGLGIARMEDDGQTINTKIGFDGYNATKTKKYPSGQPNAMIARSVESGTSFRRKNRFIKRAVDRARPAAEKAIADRFDAAIAKKFE